MRVPYPPEAMITPKARLQCRSRGATGGKEWGIKAETVKIYKNAENY